MAWTILSALAPVFGLILIGYVCGRRQVLGDRGFEVLNRFVISIALPVLTFRAIAHMNPRDLSVPAIIVAIGGGALTTYAIGYWYERRKGRTLQEANIAGVSASFSNTGFIGLPVALLAFGPQSLAPITVAMLVYSTLIFGLGVVMSEVEPTNHQSRLQGLRKAAMTIVRNPLIVAAALGLGWTLCGLPLSGPLDKLLETLAQATAPCALIAIGIFIARPREMVASAPIVRVATLKLAVQPLATAGILLLFAPIPPLWAATAVLMAAMPSGASSFVLAGKAGQWAMELSAWSIIQTTILSSVTLIAALWWLTP